MGIVIDLQLISKGLIIFLLFLLVVFYCLLQWKYRKLSSLARSLPTVLPTLPLIGHFHHALKHYNEGIPIFMVNLSVQASLKGIDTFCFWVGPVPNLIVQKPEDIKVVLNSSKTLQKSPEHGLANFITRNGLLTAPVHIWKVTKRQIRPLFHPRRLQQMMPEFNSQGRRLVALMSGKVGKGQVDAKHLIMQETLNTIVGFLFGSLVSYNSRFFKDLVKAIAMSFWLWGFRCFKYWLYWDSLFKLLYWKKCNLVKHSAITYTDPMVKILQERLNDKSNSEDIISNRVSEPTRSLTLVDVYTRIIRLNPDFNEQNFVEDMMTLTAGGTDTISVTLSNCLLVLASYPDIQEKLHEEVSSVMGQGDKDVVDEDLKNMAYLGQFIKETMRRFSTFPIVPRVAIEDITLSFGTVPAGSALYVSGCGVQMNPEFYPEPTKFDPERFSPENVAKRHKYCYMPFAWGPRGCIGKDYALLSMMVALCHIVRAYRMSTEMDLNNIQYEFVIAMKIKNGCQISFERREQPF